MTYRSNTPEEVDDLLPEGLRALQGEMGAASQEGDEVLEGLTPNRFETELLIRSLNVLDSYFTLLVQVVDATCLRIIPKIFEDDTDFDDELRNQARDTIDAYKTELRELAGLQRELAELQKVDVLRKALIEHPSSDLRWFRELRGSVKVHARLVRNHGLIEQAEALLKGALMKTHPMPNGHQKPSYARVVHDLAVAELQAECSAFADPVLTDTD